MDRRQQKTRIAIFKAFERLLAQQQFNKITVQDIIESANVGRTTFYAHFETKDALLKELCTDLFEHVFADNPNIENTHDFSFSQGDTRTIVTHILYHIRDNGRTLSRLLTGESSEAFLHYFNEYLNKLVTSYIIAGLGQKNPRVPEDFLHNHIAGSFVNTVQWWINSGMKESPEELTENYFAVIDPIL